MKCLIILLLLSGPAMACDDPPVDPPTDPVDSDPPLDGPEYGSGSSKGNAEDR